MMGTSPIPKAVKKIFYCLYSPTCFLKFGFLIIPRLGSENALLGYLFVVPYLIHSDPCLLCFQRDCLLEQVMFIFSQNTTQIPC